MYKCQYCSDVFDVKQLTLDHVLPRSRGGETTWDNIVTSCRACNTYKGSKNFKPKNQPVKPTFAHLLNGHKLNKDDFPDKVWADYIF
tara:strand:- start:1245 stop:1505 length:261 start_codon:yes stop_codon:yes gene_type:complete